jgi:hypothetical protein
MPSRELAISVEQLRAAAQQRVAETSLRVAAAEIGMEHSGLHKLLQGTSPHPGTIRKLTEWYLKRAAAGETTITSELAHAALGLLVQHLPPDRRTRASDRLLTVLRDETRVESVSSPSWLAPPTDSE